MLDFLLISSKMSKNGYMEIYPTFIYKKSNDLMIRGGDFYAIWDEQHKLWSTDEERAIKLIDKELDAYASEKFGDSGNYRVLHLWDTGNGVIDKWHKYCQKQLRDSYHTLDESLVFSNVTVAKEDYISKKLKYPFDREGSMESYDELMSTLYSPEERNKIEWAIGSIFAGDSKTIQKFIVLYGSAGTGKSTVLNIIQDLFDGYYTVFDAKALGSNSSSFALEPFKNNPLVAIQHDGDLSRIEDNTRLNSVVSHEEMTVNEKFKSAYTNRFKCFLFLGTNKPVRITDAKSGIIRRLIDVSPTGKTLPASKYLMLTSKIKFELGAIAAHCLDVYQRDAHKYDKYIPTTMLGASNDFYNFILDSFDIFKEDDGVSLKSAWEMYKSYCDSAKVVYPYALRPFKEELKNYFKTFEERVTLEDGTRIRNYYSGFITDKFKEVVGKEDPIPDDTFKFKKQKSIFDQLYSGEKAQYASESETPLTSWDNVTSTLNDIDTSKLHYVMVPLNHIVIDFDLKDENGNKSFERNYEAASKWPRTYAELSKSGAGIHLHYNYSGDVTQLSRLYDKDIEIKVFNGKSSLRRKLTKCTNNQIATISTGLPLKESREMFNFDGIKSEKALRTLIAKNLNKEIHPNTKPSMDFIKTILDQAYNSGLKYDVTDLRPSIQAFAASSTNQAKYCLQLIDTMKFSSDEFENAETKEYLNKPLVFFDVEVFPNLFLICWKEQGKDYVHRLYNPTPAEVESIINMRLVGFNCRKYDNHMLYARLMNYTNKDLFMLSQKIVKDSKNAMFGEAYNISYADVYDFSSIKQSLKKFQISLGIYHSEFDAPWDEPLPEDRWEEAGDYCANDVISTEKVFEDREQDFIARQILSDLSGLTVNDTTRMHVTKIIFGSNRHPELNYTDLSEEFPGYEFKDGHNMFRGVDLSFGGYVYAEDGMYVDVALLDVESLHPHTIISLNCLGEYTKIFEEIVNARLAIKHKDFESARNALNGVFCPYLKDEAQAKKLAGALKIIINSVYGYTAATFDNPFKDPRNVNNIVALRGALFMKSLQDLVISKGFKVAHIKTDSIKIPNATPEIIQVCKDYAKQFGYNFEHEATYSKMCLVNDAVYIAKYHTLEECEKLYGKDYVNDRSNLGKNKEHGGEWTATGTQFAVPYVYKTLFSKEPIIFDDMCETKAVTSSLYLDYNEDLAEGEHLYKFIGKVGRFCPIKPGCGGALLLRKQTNGTFAAAVGTKNYRWLESGMVKDLKKEDCIDLSYYKKLVDDAVDDISKYGDFEWFSS